MLELVFALNLLGTTIELFQIKDLFLFEERLKHFRFSPVLPF